MAARRTVDECRTRILEILKDPTFEIQSMDDLIELTQLGELALVLSWDSGGGFGAGAEQVFRLGEGYIRAPSEGDWTGPHSNLREALSGLLFISSATRRLSGAFRIEEIIDLMDLEFADDVVVINDREWPIEELRDLQQRVLAEGRAESSEMEEIDDLDYDALRCLVIGVVERGEVDVRARTWRGVAYHLESRLED